MSNLIDIQSQIAKLQKQANEIQSREFDKTIQEIHAKMQAFGITLKDLQTAKGRSKARASKVSAATKRSVTGGKKKSKSAVAAKYRGPNGETWSGRGLTPRWLTALLAQGRVKEEFVIKG